jgi:hypothetical protein
MREPSFNQRLPRNSSAGNDVQINSRPLMLLRLRYARLCAVIARMCGPATAKIQKPIANGEFYASSFEVRLVHSLQYISSRARLD